jgi:hypothetical protein
LFHQIVVEKSREIYENLIDEEDDEKEVEENFDPVGNLVDEVDAEEEIGMTEANPEMDMDMDMEMPADMGGDDAGMDDMDDMGGDDAGMDDMGGEDGGLEDRVMDLEAALDELKAEFDALMADEEGEPEHNDGESDPDFGGEEPKEESMDPAMVREYVDKVASPANAEGQTVGANSSSKPSVNKQSIVAAKNDMGGSSSNIVKGGTEQPADGKPTPKPSNQYTKGQGTINSGNRNVPGGKAGSPESVGKSYEKSHDAEGQTTSGKMPVNPKSLQGGKVR